MGDCLFLNVSLIKENHNDKINSGTRGGFGSGGGCSERLLLDEEKIVRSEKNEQLIERLLCPQRKEVGLIYYAPAERMAQFRWPGSFSADFDGRLPHCGTNAGES